MITDIFTEKNCFYIIMKEAKKSEFSFYFLVGAVIGILFASVSWM
jgi:hypothetical protein